MNYDNDTGYFELEEKIYGRLNIYEENIMESAFWIGNCSGSIRNDGTGNGGGAG